MNEEILVELDDLMRAEQELTWLLSQLRADEKEARTLYGQLDDWTGQSAETVRQQIEAFFMGLGSKISHIEQQKVELIRYVELMKQTDLRR
ncbi:hypothetical protein JCM16418A_37000 [Paenibacillus pini]|uniref:Uncharacterized protein n=1 Tax=Paenibacillus pini JCM 16418 TaxID=1236976 RepID=W7YC80_9BACL|nr:hypothetical protein JCM16418_2607 [Paenibacillus pini JCM 16418]